jgi:hypothetical protein
VGYLGTLGSRRTAVTEAAGPLRLARDRHGVTQSRRAREPGPGVLFGGDSDSGDGVMLRFGLGPAD